MMPTSDARDTCAAWETMLSNNRLLVFLTDARGIIQSVGAGTQRILKYTEQELVGRLTNGYLFDKHEVRHQAKRLSKELKDTVKPGFSALVERARRGLPDEGDWKLVSKDKSRIPIRFSVSRVDGSNEKDSGYLFVGERADQLVDLTRKVTDLETKLAVANAKLAALSVTDEVTGLKNHTAFENNLDREFKRALRYRSELSIVLLNVDDYQNYIDKFGMAASDARLKSLADLLLKGNRATDFLANIGGGVMAYLLPETNCEGALVKATRVCREIKDTLGSEVCASIGVSTLGLESPVIHGVTSGHILTKRALDALCSARHTKGNSVMHFDNLETSGSHSAGLPEKTLSISRN